MFGTSYINRLNIMLGIFTDLFSKAMGGDIYAMAPPGTAVHVEANEHWLAASNRSLRDAGATQIGNMTLKDKAFKSQPDYVFMLENSDDFPIKLVSLFSEKGKHLNQTFLHLFEKYLIAEEVSALSSVAKGFIIAACLVIAACFMLGACYYFSQRCRSGEESQRLFSNQGGSREVDADVELAEQTF